MGKLTKTIVAASATALLSIGAVAPVMAQSVSFSFGDRGDRGRADRAFNRYCDTHRFDRDCQRFRRGQFGDRDYYNFYRSHRTQLNPIAGGFGFALGTIFGAAAAGASNNRSMDRGQMDHGSYNSGHVSRCEARFRSYSAESDTYLGFDGDRHRCTL